MINKIHYCWFGRNPLPDSTKKYIESWKKYCPDFEIICWNEDNFDFSDCNFAKQAYEAKKWAFVSDYARAKILYEFGGVFVDTDVEIIKPLQGLLKNSFMGFETATLVNPGLIINAVEPKLLLFKEIVEKYKKLTFEIDSMYQLTSPIIYTQALEENGLIRNGKLQNIADFIIYPVEYFNPMGKMNRKLKITNETYAIHHYDATWFDCEEKEFFKIRKKYGKFFGWLIYGITHPIKVIKRIINGSKK